MALAMRQALHSELAVVARRVRDAAEALMAQTGALAE
jgi:hypothetical protein